MRIILRLRPVAALLLALSLAPRPALAYRWKNFSTTAFQQTQNKVRTAPLWGVRLRTRLMHDGASVTLADAIRRHRGEAAGAALKFKALSPADRKALLEFLKSL